ncbi:sodium:solute symporter family transporter [Hymenobacter glacieicola]|uniref:Sodium:solute symporter n=1 Tax=Hymenobacter glacieicola TaxID=1562124 RepID=A0ABQ1X8M1_9BACT|nr:sodium:solute symporter [Hymenobacter glacieicola]GGG61584.1 sodium:solute symporter [Hymenobacter glacieicola]
MSTTLLQWTLVLVSSVTLFLVSPLSRTAPEFFRGARKERTPNTVFLTSSLVISWLFAKSITNAANLGHSFGLVGGVAYAGYYLSFLVAGFVIVSMRRKGGYRSIHHFLESKYGAGAVVVFTFLIIIRLYNEIWSNTIVIGSYFGVQGTADYYVAIVVFTLLTLAYTLKGGMSSSIMTDVIQLSLFVVLLMVILGFILPQYGGSLKPFLSSGEWTLGQGVDLLLVAVVQCFSYPFHDPVLTDRGFISDTRTTLTSYLWAGAIGSGCIIFFSFVGIFAKLNALTGEAPVAVARYFGVPMLLLLNLIMVTSASSTLDSAMASFSKLISIDLSKAAVPSVSRGRWAMVVLTVLGTIPVFFNPAILSATTISGTLVLGLAPVFLFWHVPVPRLAFHLSVVGGLGLGGLLTLFPLPDTLRLGEGKYGALLSTNLLTSAFCFAVFGLCILLRKKPHHG